MQARYSEYPPSPPPPPPWRHFFWQNKNKGRGCNFERTMYSYWHLHECCGSVPDEITHIPCSRACIILFITENTEDFIHHFPCSFERRRQWNERIAVFLFVIAVRHNLTVYPDTDVYERCSMPNGDKGHVKYKIGSVLHRCSFSLIRERVNTVHFACCRSIRLRCVCMCGLAKIVGFVQCLHWRHHGVFEGMVFFLHSWEVCTCFIIVKNLYILVFFLSLWTN